MRRGILQTSAALLVAWVPPTAAQDATEGIAKVFESFATRCPGALADPEAYLAGIGTDPSDTRTMGATADGTLTMVMSNDMGAGEQVQIFASPQSGWRECSTGYWSSNGGQENGLVNAFKAYIDSRSDLSIVSGGEIIFDDDGGQGPMAGQRSWYYVLSGLELPEGTVLAATIGPQFLELDGELYEPAGLPAQ